MKNTGSVLIVDDDEDILVAGKLLLKRHFASVKTVNDPNHIPELMAKNDFDAILLDMNFGPGKSSGDEGFLWLRKIMKIDPEAVVVMITAHGGVNVAVEAMKQGATDFIAKPWQNEKAVATVSTAVKLRQTRNEAGALRRANRTLVEASVKSSGQTILGSSEAMKKVLGMVERTAPTDANVLILGENGTGKELIARELHQQSARKDQVFLSVDLGAVSESLFESELFGHKKGAFTDAKEDRVGRFQAADGGTLFLDEIGNLPLHLQARLLTVLEQRHVTPVGSNRQIPFDVRVIAATNVSKSKLLDEDHFRPDLLFRLNTVEIEIPPLRERSEDIEEIAKYYAALYCRKYDKPVKGFSDEALVHMQHYSWPGNIRALRHAIERAVILGSTELFEAVDFPFDVAPQKPGGNAAPSEAKLIDELVEADGFNLEKMEKTLVSKSLKKHRYNISHAAKELGLTRAALYRRMEKYGF